MKLLIEIAFVIGLAWALGVFVAFLFIGFTGSAELAIRHLYFFAAPSVMMLPELAHCLWRRLVK